MHCKVDSRVNVLKQELYAYFKHKACLKTIEELSITQLWCTCDCDNC